MATTNHTARNIIRPSRSPRLPAPSPQYSRENLDQFQSALRLYFNETDAASQALFGPFGLRFLNAVYGAFSSNQDQAAANTTTAYAMTFNITDYANGVFVANNSQLTVTYPGIYNLQFSAQFTNPEALEQDVSVWFRKNGVDLPYSNGQFSIGPKHGTVDGALVPAFNFFVDLLAGDYLQIMWSVSNITVVLQHIDPQTAPVRPATPSIIATLAFVSAIPE